MNKFLGSSACGLVLILSACGGGGGGGGGGGSMKVTLTTSSSSTSWAGGEIGESSSSKAAACSAMAKLMPTIRGQLRPPSRLSFFSGRAGSCVMRTALVWGAPGTVRRGDSMRLEGRRNLLVYTNRLHLFQAQRLMQTIPGGRSQRARRAFASSGFFRPLSSAF